MKRNLYLLIIVMLKLSPAAVAQKWIEIDLVNWVKTIPEIPPTVQEVHGKFSLPSSEGDRFADAVILNPFFQQVEGWLSEIHAETIHTKISNHRNIEMEYEVQFNDELLKLALRPLRGKELLDQLKNDPISKKNVEAFFELEKSFDWQNYYSAYDKIMKEQQSRNADWNSLAQELRDQVPMVETEWGLQKDPVKEKEVDEILIRKKLADGVEMFQKHQKAWEGYFSKYKKGIIKFQEISKSVYFDKADKQIVRYISDVQARGLEAIGKMIWLQYIIVGYGELVFHDWKIVNQSLSQIEQ